MSDLLHILTADRNWNSWVTCLKWPGEAKQLQWQTPASWLAQTYVSMVLLKLEAPDAAYDMVVVAAR